MTSRGRDPAALRNTQLRSSTKTPVARASPYPAKPTMWGINGTGGLVGEGVSLSALPPVVHAPVTTATSSAFKQARLRPRLRELRILSS